MQVDFCRCAPDNAAMTHASLRLLGSLSLAGTLVCAGCGPDFQASANRLRAQTITQQNQIADLQAKLAARDSIIQGLRSQLDDRAPRVQTLPQARLAQLFTVGRLDVSSDTRFTNLGNGARGLRVFIRTRTDDGMIFPATGTLTIEAFALAPAPAQPSRIGTWTFSPEEMKKNWYSGLGLNHFAFNCPAAPPPGKSDLVIKATFIDALTGKTLDATLTKKIAATE
jgi:hypothetical protein